MIHCFNFVGTDLSECLIDTTVSATQNEKYREEEIIEKMTHVEEIEDADSVLEKYHHQEKFLKKNEEKKDYIEVQQSIILTQEERKIMWNEYKNYVDQTVFNELQFATLCR